MGGFDSETNRMVTSDDGSCTAYSVLFDEHYHSTKDGALNESLQKHVIPALTLQADKETLTILDICYGLGFNTLATLYYLREKGIRKKVHIVSPEMDEELVRSLDTFTYPEAFGGFEAVIESVSKRLHYDDGMITIDIVIGDAREYLRNTTEHFDIVYQDAFSPSANPALWTQEYFADLARVMREDAVLTTYSTALRTRLALHQNGFNVYLNKGEGYRNATLASRRMLNGYEAVDMEHKIACNPEVHPLTDAEVSAFKS